MGAANSRIAYSRLDGKTAVVTGCNTGIGKETVKELYRAGARVIMACRDMERAQAALDDIKKELAESSDLGELTIKQLDLSELASVRKCADELNQQEKSLNFLINNAGVMMCPKGQTKDGFETHFGVNHLGHFLFTCLLLPKICSSAPSRIINVSSLAHERAHMNWDDLHFDKTHYNNIRAYAQSKLANVLFTVELAKRLKDKNVTVYSLHPGVVKTELSRHLDATYFRGARAIVSTALAPFSKTPEEGARTTLYCVFKEVAEDSGAYFSDCTLKKLCMDDEKYLKDAERLWEVSKKLVDIEPTI